MNTPTSVLTADAARPSADAAVADAPTEPRAPGRPSPALERPTRLEARNAVRAAGRAQALVGVGQLVAGLGNLLFIAVAARRIPVSGFGHLASFIALLTALNLPGAGLAAAGALSPERGQLLTRRGAVAGAALGLGVALGAGQISSLLGLPIPFVMALAVSAPAAALLGLRRGVAYGQRDHRAVVVSLVAEPATRLIVGLTLGVFAGAAGAAWGVALGGWASLLTLRRIGSPPSSAVTARKHPTAASTARNRVFAATAVAFVGLALLQHVDLMLASRLLGAREAGAFAALSTLGGLVAFATATLPLVLMPDHEERGTLTVAVAIAAAVGVGAVGLALVAGEALIELSVGGRYTAVASLLPRYLAAMGALGVARVLAAHRCAKGGAGSVARIAAITVVAQVAGLVLFARTTGEMVTVTTTTLLAGAAVLSLPDRQRLAAVDATRSLGRWGRDVFRRPDAWLVTGLSLVAFAIRLATERSFWIDEAVSVQQAQMPLGEMLTNIRATDVHPPLHHLILWVTAHLFGTGELAMRLPSIVAGAALMPVLYGATLAIFDRRTARVAALLAVPAPFLVWYSQEARMYSLFMLIGVVSVWAQVVALRTSAWRPFVIWGLASAALLWTQWFALLPLAVQQVLTLVHLVRIRRDRPVLRRQLGRWFGSLGVTLLAVLPLLPFVLDQLAAYGERGAGLSTPSAAGADSSSVVGGLDAYTVIANLAWAVGGYHSDAVMVRLGALWPLAILGCLLLLGRKLTRASWAIALVALVPAAALFVIAHTKRDLFELRYFVLAVPLLLILVARSLTSVARRPVALGVLATALFALSSVALVDQQVNGTNPRLYDFRGAVSAIEETARPGDVMAYAPSYLDGVLGYYGPELEGLPLAALDQSEVEGQIFVVVSERFLTEGRAGDVGELLSDLSQERGEPERIERPNVVVWRFS